MKRPILIALILSLMLFAACATPSPAPTEAPTAPAAPSPATTAPSGAISWNEAKYHIGERATVCGPVVSATWASGSKGKPTFLNIGKPYPDPERFTVVIWIQNRGNFPQAPEVYYSGKTICVTGLIIEYKGIPEIEVKDPSQIQEQ